MTASMLACYREPADRDAFDRHYADVHARICLDLPGLRSFTGTWPGPGPDGSAPPYYFVATLAFDDEQAMGAALTGEAGAAAVRDLRSFAQAGVDVMTGPTTSFLG